METVSHPHGVKESPVPNEAPVSRKEVDEKVELVLSTLRAHKAALWDRITAEDKGSSYGDTLRYVQIDQCMKELCKVLKPFVKGQ